MSQTRSETLSLILPRAGSIICWLLGGGVLLAFSMLAASSPVRADAQTNRIKIAYFPPTNPALEPVYRLLKERRTLEKLQEIFSPLRLPIELTLQTGDCGGVSNAWYDRPTLSICYEYVHEILQGMPKETTAEGITPTEACIGPFFFVVAHEMGHAVFDIFDVPIFGNAEDAADHFATYVMLQFGKEDSRQLITGAAYSYKMYIQNPEVTAPLKAFADIHGAPAQRFYNLLCLAYGAHAEVFADVVEKGFLPKERAQSCKREYDQVTFAFRDLVVPHLDRQLARQVMDKTWLPEVKARAPVN
jgi:hypothetical protein